MRAGPTLFRTLMVLLAIAVCGSLARAQDTTTFFRIGTGPAADTLYALGSSIAAGITNPPGSLPCRQGGSCGVPGLIAVALSKGEIDAFFVVGGAPVQAIATLAEKMPIRLLPIRDAETQQLLTLYPFFSFSSIPASTYEGVEADVPSVSLGVLWVVTSEQDDLFIRDATRALWSPNTARFLRTSHPEGALVTIERARQNLSIPLHDGAAAFYDSLEVTN